MQAAPEQLEVPNAGGDGLPTVPIDELDFDFVAKCSDHTKLRDILTILESGKEGHYPELIQATIDRLKETLPPKELKLFVALRSSPSAVDEDEARSSLSDWIGQISKVDAAVESARASAGGEGNVAATAAAAAAASAAAAAAATSKDIFTDDEGVSGGGSADAASSSDAVISKVYSSRVPVRNQAGSSSNVNAKKQLGSSRASIHGDGGDAEVEPRWTENKPDPKARDFKSYYDDWDKFDADREVDKLDADDQAKEAERRRKQQEQQRRLEEAAVARKARSRHAPLAGWVDAWLAGHGLGGIGLAMDWIGLDGKEKGCVRWGWWLADGVARER
jgi:hypothetical protein